MHKQTTKYLFLAVAIITVAWSIGSRFPSAFPTADAQWSWYPWDWFVGPAETDPYDENETPDSTNTSVDEETPDSSHSSVSLECDGFNCYADPSGSCVCEASPQLGCHEDPSPDGSCPSGWTNWGMGCCPPAGTTCFDESSPCPNGFGTCVAGACLCGIPPPVCGDGQIDSGETCATCAADVTCASGTQCCSNDGTCRALCTDATCGNTVIDAGEECDDGNVADDDGCNAVCKLEYCGDSACNNGETCSSCPGDCTQNCGDAECGNGIVDLGEQCDYYRLNTTTCDADCTFPACPDGNVNHLVGEECDDGNMINSDYCRNDCKSTYCGDGILSSLEGFEECDDGNRTDGDGCNQHCEEEERTETNCTDNDCENHSSCAFQGFCGAGACEGSETRDSCELFCGECGSDPVCGDGAC